MNEFERMQLKEQSAAPGGVRSEAGSDDEASAGKAPRAEASRETGRQHPDLQLVRTEPLELRPEVAL